MKTVKGTRDLLPEDTAIFQAIEQRAFAHFAKYGFHEIRTPIFEQTQLFARGIGEGTDIVNKEMYTFEDRGGRSVTLRPEMTAAVCRAVAQHNLVQGDDPVRLLYTGPTFRYERPQAGRYRQFYQLGAEVFGSDDPLIDAETIEALITFLEPFELPNLTLVLNSVGDHTDRPRYLAYLRATLADRVDQLCGDCKVRIDKNVLRVLDCKNPTCQAQMTDLETIDAFWSDENRQHFEAVKQALDGYGIQYTLNPRLVRGLDYYTKTAFELLSGDLGAQSAVMGGGRYDGLVKMVGGPNVPGFGWAVGLDRLVSIIAKYQNIQPSRPDLFFVYGERSWLDADLPFIRDLRRAGLSVAYDSRCGSFKSQFKRADKYGAAFVAVIGEAEQDAQTIQLKNMATGEQTTVARAGLVAHIREASHA